MTNDLDDRLRAAADGYPLPHNEATRRARKLFLRHVGNAMKPHPSSRSRRLLVSRVGLVAAVFVVSVGGAFGAGFSLGSSPGRPTTSQGSDGPGFLPAYGWNVLQTGLTVPPEGPSTIAANVPFSPRDLAIGGRPTETIKSLGPDGILIYAMFIPSGQIASVDRQFPQRSLPLRLADAESGGLEGLPAAGETLRMLARTGGYNIDVLIIFGSPSPSSALLAAADEELARLVVPECPRDSLRVTDGDRPAAESYVLEWIRTHYIGDASDLEGAESRSYIIGAESAPHGPTLVTECGASVRERVVEVEVTLSSAAQRTTGRFPLTYYVVKRSAGWNIWRQG